jgi:hypothetical protein
MKMRRVMTIRPHKYGTRHLTAGEEYELPPRHAVALVAAKKARFLPAKPAAPSPEAEPEPPAHEPEPMPVEPEVTIDSLRLQATQLGVDIDGRWGVARLQHEIDEARQR